ncbi:MAG: hypothetical protein GZ094_06260 [Mariniphaga sp.]|nr:hypothetical protein [Mariniphaga sp.]
MRTLHLTVLLLSIVMAKTTFAVKPAFLIVSKAICDDNLKSTVSSQLITFQTQVAIEIGKAFPCAKVKTQYENFRTLDNLRQRELLGEDIQDQLLDFAKQLNTDFLIGLQIKVVGQTAMIRAVCLNNKKAKTMAMAMKSIPFDSFPMSIYEEITKKLIDGLKQYEICPFTGPVNVMVNSTRDTTITEEYPVYCNGMDQQYKKVTRTSNYSESTWNLVRKGIPWTDGTMKFFISQEEKIVEENGCYKCPSGREGGRTYNEKKSLKVTGSGISHESIHDGKTQQDTRIELEFLDNGTYLIKPMGTSLPAISDQHFEFSAQGTCDNLPPKNETIKKETTVPLNPVFGPYPGKSTDKVLQQKDEKKIKNPVTLEEETISIDFSLKQKEN